MRHASTISNALHHKFIAYAAFLCLCLTCLFNCAATFAQQNLTDTAYFVKHYSQENGMAGPGGYTMQKDNRGFLWIGSFQGISRFDGHGFTAFTTKDGLYENTISDLKCDTSGIIYACSATGLYRYTGAINHPFKIYHLSPSLKFMSSICPIDSNNIYLFDVISRKLYHLAKEHLYPIVNFPTDALSMQFSKNGLLYVLGINHRIYAIKDTNIIGSVLIPTATTSNHLDFKESLQVDSSGQIIYNGIGIWSVVGSGPSLNDYKGPALFYNISFLANKTGMLYRTSQGNTQPLLLTNVGQGGPRPLLPLTNINLNSSVFAGENGSIKLISDNGFDCYYPKLYILTPRTPLVFYFITTPSGCRVFRHDSSLYHNPLALQTYLKLKSNLRNIYQSRDKTIWFCHQDGVYYLPQGNGPLRFYSLPKTSQPDNFLVAMEDSKNRIWFQTYSGIFCYEGGQFKHWSKANGLLDDDYYCSGVDKHDIFYAASRSIYAWVDGKPQLINGQLGLNREQILSITVDHDKNLWICTSKGLLKVGADGKGRFFVADSLMPEVNDQPFVPQSITFDSTGNLYISSYNQMAVYIRQPNGHFTSNDKIVMGDDQHLRRFTFNRSFVTTAEDGRYVYLGHDSVFAIFNMKDLLKSHHHQPPNLQFTTVSLFRQKTDWQALGQQLDKYGLPINPVLKSTQNLIGFQFTGIVDLEPDAIKYRFKLDGYDNDWQPISQLNEVYYTNLSPGSYVFYVKAADINGVWSLPKAFSFSILPPWYRTWWAWFIWWLLLLGGNILMYKRVKTSLKRRERMKRLVVEQQLKALRAQINPHFLQNTFMFLSQTLQQQPLDRSLQIIAQLSSYLRNVLDNSDVAVVTMEDELAFAEEYLAINQLVFRNSFSYTIDISDEVDIYHIKVPSMLLQPLLENAIKHGVLHHNNDKSSITIKVYPDIDFLCCVVGNTIASDFPKSTLVGHTPKGLNITEQRLSLLYKNANHPPSITASTTHDRYEVTICIPL